ncbi:hypothetical protein PIB30_074544 [Stylosanthes scabra]|uniref:BZIP domain-containing protein n=1 Tax=Stylosanthes scabra TaxID=79078 RepID=A0ABU6QQJ0_9FABA|nr:hypothetical protein [Stylosanthes scabra]
MQSFKTAQTSSQLYCHSPFLLRGDNNTNRNSTRFSDLGELQHSATVFHHQDAVDLSHSSMFNMKSNNVAVSVAGTNLQYGTLNTNLGSGEVGGSGMGMGNNMALGNGNVENWGDSGMVGENSQQTDDTSTDIETDDRNQCNRVQNGAPTVVDSKDETKIKADDAKTMRRLAQNREAARKSRLRKKAYVQQLENSRAKLLQLEQELQRARQQGIFIATNGDNSNSSLGNGN